MAVNSIVFLFAVQPWAFQAREFLRKKVIGKEVCFTVDRPKGVLTREYGMMYLGKGKQYLFRVMNLSAKCLM